MPNQTEKLYTLSEVATYCGRSLQLLREYYADGILPDPKFTRPFKRGVVVGKDRRFTQREMDQIRDFFESIKRGTVKVIKKRAERRKRIENAINET